MAEIASSTKEGGKKFIRSHPFARILTSSALAVGARIGGACFGIAGQIVLARMLSAQDLGLFFLAFSLASVMSIVCTLGYQMIIPKIVAETVDEAQPGRLKEFLTSARSDTAILSGVAAAAIIAGLTFWPGLSPILRTCLIVGCLTAPALAFLRLHSALANAHRRFVLGFFPELFARPLLLLVLVGGVFLTVARPDVTMILVGQFAIVLLLAVWQFSRLSSVEVPEYPVSKHTDIQTVSKSERGRWRRSAMPLVIATLFITVFADLDLLIAGIFLSEAQIGVFGVCLKISMFLAFAIQAVHQITFRDAADALQQNDRDRLHRVLAWTNAMTLIASLGGFVVMALFAGDILGIFGPAFRQGATCLTILMLAQVVRAAAGPATQILALTGHERASVPVFAGALVLLFAANAVLIGYFGINGAAAAVLLTTAAWSMGLARIAKTRENIRTTVIW